MKLKISLICLIFLLMFSGAVLAADDDISIKSDANEDLSGDRVKITAIHIEGNRRIEDAAIKMQLITRVDDIFDISRINEDIKNIFKMGYFKDIKVIAKETDHGRELIYIVSENPSIKIIKLNGNKKLKNDELLEIITLKNRDILKLSRIKENEERIKAFYNSKGFFDAEISYELIHLSDHDVDVVYKIKENKKAYVEEIKFSGNKTFEDSELSDEMETSEKGWFSFITSSGLLNKDMLEIDRNRLANFYQNKGFIEIKVGQPVITQEGNKIYIAIAIEEGDRYKVGSVDITGDLIEDKEVFLSKLNTDKSKDYYSREVLRWDIDTLTRFYADKGFAYADISPVIKKDTENKLLNITFNIIKGNLIYFDRITVSGNTKTRDKVIRRELRVVEAELFSATGLQKSEGRLRKTDFFKNVSIQTTDGAEDDKINLNIEIEEQPTGSMSFGAGYSSEDGLTGMASISQRNFLGRGQGIGLSLNVTEKSKYYDISFTEPYFLDTSLSAGIDLGRLNREYDAYDKKSDRFNLRFSYPVSDLWRVYTSYRIENTRVTNIDEDASYIIFNFEGNYRTHAVKWIVERDSRDRTLMPTRGSLNYVSCEFAGKPLAGNVGFVKYNTYSDWFFPLFWKLVFRTKLQTGYIQERKSGELPLYEKFYVGGINTVRGMEYGEASPEDPSTGDILGAYTMVVNNFEILFPLIPKANMQGVFFFDIGRGFDKWEEVRFNDLRRTAGAGIRWFSPMGPLRLEWGYNLKREDNEGRSNWEFSIGTTF